MKLDIDQEFLDHFKNLKQVFLYITDECNLYCEQCIYKPSITFHMSKQHPYIPYETALNLISDFHEMGASKLTFIGGEPTTYGLHENNKPLLDLIRAAKNMGYEHVRLDTNGQFRSTLLDEPDFKKLDELAFSLEGYSPELNDPIRGENTFNNATRNIRKAKELGYGVSITCCVHRKLIERDEHGKLLIDKMIRFAESNGVDIINFHDLFKVGVPMDTWTGDLAPTPKEWVEVYPEIKEKMDKGEYKIQVRLPQCFVPKTEFAKNPNYYGYCPVKLGERVMVHPNGTIRICSNLICTAFGAAKWFGNRIWWERSNANEILDHDINKMTPCTNRSKMKTYGEYVPLCFSFKPDQEEIIWKDKLNWESRKITS